MKKFSEFVVDRKNINEIEDKLNLLLYMSESNILNESLDNLTEAEITEGVKDWLNKFGLKIHKGDGVIDYIRQFSGGAGKLILAAIKGDKEEVKKIAGSLEKEKVVDFIFKLDMMSMHLITGPIHFIDALTGWDLVANIKHASKNAPSIIKDIIQSIKKIRDGIVKVVSGEHKKNILHNLASIEASIPKA